MCDHSVCTAYYNMSFFCCFVLLPSVCIISYSVFFEMCQTILIRSVHSPLLQFEPYGSDLYDLLPQALQVNRTRSWSITFTITLK